MPVVREIVERHLAGTRYGIGATPDGLLAAGEPGVQLTWMDARVDDCVVTPRIGKPVEIQALWHATLRFLSGWLAARGEASGADRYRTLAERCRASFLARFWRPDLGYLADVVDGPDGDDLRLRPNQVLAASLPHPLIDGEIARSVVAAVGRELHVSHGLRSLAAPDPAYRGVYGGDRLARDGAYHQGTAWSWLIGPYTEAVWRTTGDAEAALSLLRPFGDHLADAGLGSVSEIFDGDPPHAPRGCIAQAWGVAEVLRVARMLSRERASASRPAAS